MLEWEYLQLVSPPLNFAPSIASLDLSTSIAILPFATLLLPIPSQFLTSLLRNLLRSAQDWIDVTRSPGEGEEAALRFLNEEVLSVKDYYEFEATEDKCDVMMTFFRVWKAINGDPNKIIEAINASSKLGAAKMCRACVRSGLNFEQDVMVEMATKSLGIRVVTDEMNNMLKRLRQQTNS